VSCRRSLAADPPASRAPCSAARRSSPGVRSRLGCRTCWLFFVRRPRRAPDEPQRTGARRTARNASASPQRHENPVAHDPTREEIVYTPSAALNAPSSPYIPAPARRFGPGVCLSYRRARACPKLRSTLASSSSCRIALSRAPAPRVIDFAVRIDSSLNAALFSPAQRGNRLPARARGSAPPSLSLLAVSAARRGSMPLRLVDPDAPILRRSRR